MGIQQDLKYALSTWFSVRAAEIRYGSRHWAVLCLHEVPDREEFNKLLNKIQELYRVVSLSEGFKSIKIASITKPMLTLTFDDADKTVFTNCLPELRDRSIPACLFVCTGFVEARFREVSTGRYAVMSWEDLGEWVEAKLEVGAHTVNHIPLNQATLDRCKWEILECKHILEKRLKCEVPHFAYPWGYYTERLDRWLQEQNAFMSICTTIPRDNYPNQSGKHVYRKPAPCANNGWEGKMRNQSLFQTLRAIHHRSVLNGLAPVVWRLQDDT